MINSKTLGSAAGVQYQGVIDKTETNSLPSLANAVITGRFKRGRMDKPFKVTASNYQALLGRDPSNPNYLSVEDAFKRGISEVSILRTGGNSSVIKCTPTHFDIVFNNAELPFQYLTVSKNNQPAVTLDMFDVASTPAQQSKLASDFLFTSADNHSIAFVDATAFGVYPTPNGGDGALTLPVTGISSNMVELGGQSYDLLQTGVNISGSHFVISEIVTETTTVTIYPTPNASPSEDAYYVYGGNDTGTPVVMTSCAKAIIPTINNSVTIGNFDGNFNSADAFFSILVNGVMYNADKSQDVTGLDAPDLYAQISMYRSSDGSINFSPNVGDRLSIRLSPSDTQKQYSNAYLSGDGTITDDGTFVFILQAP